jgi:hypothetical protein
VAVLRSASDSRDKVEQKHPYTKYRCMRSRAIKQIRLYTLKRSKRIVPPCLLIGVYDYLDFLLSASNRTVSVFLKDIV